MLNREEFKVISGGQIGADLAGLEAARVLGITTGGWIPFGWRTELGSKPEYGTKYGLQETLSSSYDDRTERNIMHSNGTVIFLWEESPGSRKTRRICMDAGRPVLVISRTFPGDIQDYDKIGKFLREHRIKTLNVAGNRESVAPGIGSHAQWHLEEAFKSYLGLPNDVRKP